MNWLATLCRVPRPHLKYNTLATGDLGLAAPAETRQEHEPALRDSYCNETIINLILSASAGLGLLAHSTDLVSLLALAQAPQLAPV